MVIKVFSVNVLDVNKVDSNISNLAKVMFNQSDQYELPYLIYKGLATCSPQNGCGLWGTASVAFGGRQLQLCSLSPCCHRDVHQLQSGPTTWPPLTLGGLFQTAARKGHLSLLFVTDTVLYYII